MSTAWGWDQRGDNDHFTVRRGRRHWLVGPKSGGTLGQGNGRTFLNRDVVHFETHAPESGAIRIGWVDLL
jgi:hypothetical protein